MITLAFTTAEWALIIAICTAVALGILIISRRV